MLAHLRRFVRITLRLGLVATALAGSVCGGTELDLLTPGTLGLELHAALGEPRGANTEAGGWNEDFVRPEQGLARITVWYSADGFVEWGRIVLVNDLKPAAAVLLFDILGGPVRTEGHAFADCAEGHTIHYPADGVHFYVRGGRVAEVWRTKPRADLTAIRAAGASYPPRPLPATPPVVRVDESVDEEWLPDPIEEWFGDAEPADSPDPFDGWLEPVTGGDPTDPFGGWWEPVKGEDPADPFGGLWEPGPGNDSTDPFGTGGQQVGGAAASDLHGRQGQVQTGSRRMLEVGPIRATLDVDAEFHPVIRVTSPVRAHGLRDQVIRFEGSLYPMDMSGPLLASLGSPGRLRTPDGVFRPRLADRVLSDRAEWKAAELTYPLRHVSGIDELSGWYVVDLEVVCGGLSAYSSRIVNLPGSDSPPEPAPRLVQGAFTTQDAEVESLGKGIWIHIPLEAIHAPGSTMVCLASLRTVDHRPVMVMPGWDDWRADDGSFLAQGVDEVLYEESQWDAFRLFVPLGAFALVPGEHTLVLRLESRLSSVGAAREAEIRITVPAR